MLRTLIRHYCCLETCDVCMVCYHTGTKKSPSDSNFEVDLHDGEDGGIEMEVHRRHRGILT